MDKPPSFLETPERLSSEEIFRPAPPNRRGELVAWACAAAVGVVIVFLQRIAGEVPALAWILLALFAISGLLISFSNWMDARTMVSLTKEGAQFSSPLRKVRIEWSQVEELMAVPVGRGWRLYVRGTEGYFGLRTGAEIGLGSSQSMGIGFPDSDRLASIVIGMAGLSPAEHMGDSWVCRRKVGSPRASKDNSGGKRMGSD